MNHHVPDITGQVAPPGMKPRVTATLWEDEGSLCFQVEANGVCVARREDNHMINGTKLLNVAGMTRGRRDGILKSEKTRHVVKIGPMHLKGVWIPFERALEFANKEKITELLYPLFVHNINALLYHPSNQNRQSVGGTGMVTSRRPDQPDYMRTPQGTHPPALTHHHSMSQSIPQSIPPPVSTPASSSAMANLAGSGRPLMDRAHTFPTPPQSATGLNVSMGASGSSYDYANGNAGAGGTTTPPSHSATALSYPTSQAYEPRSSYGSAYANHYASNSFPGRYPALQPAPGLKSEMGPPARAGVAEADSSAADGKQHNDSFATTEAENENEGEYTHISVSHSARPLETHQPNPAPGSMHSDSSHISPGMAHSPHLAGSGRATPRTTSTSAYPSYQPSSRPAQLATSNLNFVVSSDRSTQPSADAYSVSGSVYGAAGYSSMNGTGLKRAREDDGDDENEDEDDNDGRQRTNHHTNHVDHYRGDVGIKRQRTDQGVRPMPVVAGVRP
ncbi:apses-domain-containing protein [Piedraia hortae CBS 480.64]|uniref:Apses-domain-containing protein n=1 Tax=Piedraia hortae CBS 480.64 TaxID=1314780 RepID=A0A6A7C653_9PEZI|nr:apses-domain-containing protein [Piedraia hortae CBS 480.64]